MATKTLKPLDAAANEKVRQYILDLRSECKRRRIHETELVAEVARLTYLIAGLQTADEPEVQP